MKLTGPIARRPAARVLFLTIFVIIWVITPIRHLLGQETQRPCGLPTLEELGDSWDTKMPACDFDKPCDDPYVRDGYIWDIANGSIVYLRMKIHVITEDDGTNPAATAQTVQNHMNMLNNDLLPFGIQFVWEMRFYPSSQYRNITGATFGSLDPMKAEVYEAPDSQLNIIVTHLDNPCNSWTAPPNYTLNPIGYRGGIVMSTNTACNQFTTDTSRHTISHEMGHVFGLRHPYLGYTELLSQGFPCNHPCAEHMGTGSDDYRGDKCADTPPQLWWGGCTFAGAGIDQCSGQAWPATNNFNFMNTSNTCKSEFTPNQTAMMHCYLRKYMHSWITGVYFDADTTVGTVPLDVQFTGYTDKNPTTWSWDFGDGDSASAASPNHTYMTAGTHRVAVEIDSPEGLFEASRAEYIAIHADTLAPQQHLVNAGQTVAVDISCHNYLPVTEMMIPIDWSGGLNVSFDSVVNTGLRTESMSFVQLSYDIINSRAAFRLRAPAPQYLDTGSAPVLTAYFTVDSAAATDTAYIDIAGYSIYDPVFTSRYGVYVPTTTRGWITTDCCEGIHGNVNGDSANEIDVSDLTFLVSFMFKGGATPPCLDAANINGDPAGALDVSDLTFLVSYMFKSGASPPSCD